MLGCSHKQLVMFFDKCSCYRLIIFLVICEFVRIIYLFEIITRACTHASCFYHVAAKFIFSLGLKNEDKFILRLSFSIFQLREDLHGPIMVFIKISGGTNLKLTIC